MTQPGPAVYWRRRIVAAAVVLGLAVMVVWAISGPSPSAGQRGGDPGPTGYTALAESQHAAEQAQPPASGAPAPDAAGSPGQPAVLPPTPLAVPTPGQVPASASAQPAAPLSSAPSSSAPVSVLPTRASAAPSPRPSAALSAQPSSALSTQPSAAVPAPNQPSNRVQASTSGTATAVPACSDRVIKVSAQLGAQTYRVGQRPEFRLVVSNEGKTPCTRDLDPGLQQLVVTDTNGRVIWDSNHCFPAKKTDVRVLQPGRSVVFPVSWAGRTSNPGCTGNRQQVPAGTYHLIAKLGSLTSSPTPFILTQ